MPVKKLSTPEIISRAPEESASPFFIADGTGMRYTSPFLSMPATHAPRGGTSDTQRLWLSAPQLLPTTLELYKSPDPTPQRACEPWLSKALKASWQERNSSTLKDAVSPKQLHSTIPPLLWRGKIATRSTNWTRHTRWCWKRVRSLPDFPNELTDDFRSSAKRQLRAACRSAAAWNWRRWGSLAEA